MKKIMIVLFLCSIGMNAQEKRFEKIKAYKTAHITEALSLTSSEAEKFWPIYNAHEEKMMELRKNEREEIGKKFKKDKIDELSDSEANALIKNFEKLRFEALENEKSLRKALVGILSPQKIIKLHFAEEQFKRELLRRFNKKDNKGSKGDNRGGSREDKRKGPRE